MKRENCIQWVTLAITVVLTVIFGTAYMLFRNEVWVSIADDLVFPAACTILGALTIALVGRTTASRLLNRNKNTGGGTETRSACLENCTSTGILILTFGLLTVFILTYIFYSDQSWGGIVRSLFFPLCYTAIGTVIVAWACTSIADEFLDHYNDRVKEGLANRKLFFKGNDRMIESIRGDLKYSGLINDENYMSNTTGITESDLVILCIGQNYPGSHERGTTDTGKGGPEADDTDSGRTSEEPKGKNKRDTNNEADPRTETSKKSESVRNDSNDGTQWKDTARKKVEGVLAKVGQDSRRPALIVYTDGWLDGETKKLIDARPFTALVNTRGRIVSDIHSLLTTLPPRS